MVDIILGTRKEGTFGDVTHILDGLAEMAIIGSSGHGQLAMGSAGGFQAIVHSIRTSIYSSKVCAAACDTVRAVCNGFEPNKALATKSN